MTALSITARRPDSRSAGFLQIAFRLLAFIAVAAFVSGCATLPLGSSYPKTVSPALTQP